MLGETSFCIPLAPSIESNEALCTAAPDAALCSVRELKR